ncbi:MAG: hypothetical protein QW692_04785, partial [Nitrososphaerota archaeon]
VDARRRLMELEAEKILVSSRLIELQEKLEKLKQQEEKRRAEIVKEKLKAEARLKLATGRKLSFEEFKALMEDGEELEKLVEKR